MELVETAQIWKQRPHIMMYFQDTVNERPTDFLGKFYDGHDPWREQMPELLVVLVASSVVVWVCRCISGTLLFRDLIWEMESAWDLQDFVKMFGCTICRVSFVKMFKCTMHRVCCQNFLWLCKFFCSGETIWHLVYSVKRTFAGQFYVWKWKTSQQLWNLQRGIKMACVAKDCVTAL